MLSFVLYLFVFGSLVTPCDQLHRMEKQAENPASIHCKNGYKLRIPHDSSTSSSNSSVENKTICRKFLDKLQNDVGSDSVSDYPRVTDEFVLAVECLIQEYKPVPHRHMSDSEIELLRDFWTCYARFLDIIDFCGKLTKGLFVTSRYIQDCLSFRCPVRLLDSYYEIEDSLGIYYDVQKHGNFSTVLTTASYMMLLYAPVVWMCGVVISSELPKNFENFENVGENEEVSMNYVCRNGFTISGIHPKYDAEGNGDNILRRYMIKELRTIAIERHQASESISYLSVDQEFVDGVECMVQEMTPEVHRGRLDIFVPDLALFWKQYVYFIEVVDVAGRLKSSLFVRSSFRQASMIMKYPKEYIQYKQDIDMAIKRYDEIAMIYNHHLIN